MKYLILPIILAASIAVACEVTPTDLSPDETNFYANLIQTHEQAVADGDTVRAEKADETLRAFEEQVFRRKAGPVLAGINAVAPATVPFTPMLLGLLPLASRRGRKHFAKGVKAIMPGVPNPDGTKSMSPGEAIASLGRYLGMKHSSEGTEKVFEAEAA